MNPSRDRIRRQRRVPVHRDRLAHRQGRPRRDREADVAAEVAADVRDPVHTAIRGHQDHTRDPGHIRQVDRRVQDPIVVEAGAAVVVVGIVVAVVVTVADHRPRPRRTVRNRRIAVVHVRPVRLANALISHILANGVQQNPIWHFSIRNNIRCPISTTRECSSISNSKPT